MNLHKLSIIVGAIIFNSNCLASNQFVNKSFIINYKENNHDLCLTYYPELVGSDELTDDTFYITRIIPADCNNISSVSKLRFYLRPDSRIALAEYLDSFEEFLCLEMFDNAKGKKELATGVCGSSDSGQKFEIDPIHSGSAEYLIRNADYKQWCLEHPAEFNSAPQFSQCDPNSKSQKFTIGLTHNPIELRIKNHNTGDQNADITVSSPVSGSAYSGPIFESNGNTIPGKSIVVFQIPSPWTPNGVGSDTLKVKSSKSYSDISTVVGAGDAIYLDMPRNADVMRLKRVIKEAPVLQSAETQFKLTDDQSGILFYKNKVRDITLTRGSTIQVYEESGFHGSSTVEHLRSLSPISSKTISYQGEQIGSIKLITESGENVKFKHNIMDIDEITNGDIVVGQEGAGEMVFYRVRQSGRDVRFEKIGPYGIGEKGNGKGDIYVENSRAGIVRFYYLIDDFTRPFTDKSHWIDLPISTWSPTGEGHKGNLFVQQTSSNSEAELWMLREDGSYGEISVGSKWKYLGFIEKKILKIHLWASSGSGKKGQIFSYENPHYSRKKEYWMLNKDGSYGYLPIDRQSTNEWIYWGLAENLGEGLELFDEPNLAGDSIFITENVSDLAYFKNRMSSFTMPKGWDVRFYTEEDYQGKMYTREGLESFASEMNNAIKSVQILSKG